MFKHALVAGANGSIGSAFIESLLDRGAEKVFAVYRKESEEKRPSQLSDQRLGEHAILDKYSSDNVIPIFADVTDEEDVLWVLDTVLGNVSELHFLVNCVGYLHNDDYQPEKSLRKINEEQFLNAVKVNTLPTVLLAKHFMKLMKHKEKAVFAAISARVGSVEDNRAGGWYSYRGSKAMLNMMISNIAVEFNRSCPNVKVLALHPGTVYSKLIVPFSKNMDSTQIITPDYSVMKMMSVIDEVEKNPLGDFRAWDGEKIPW